MFPIGLIFAIAVLASPAAASVTWTFSETSCTVAGTNADCSPSSPLDLLDLIVPGINSAGTADLVVGIGPGGFPFPPNEITKIFTGDPFDLDINGVITGTNAVISSTSPFVSSPPHLDVGTESTLSWSASAAGIMPHFDIAFFLGRTQSDLVLNGTSGGISSDLGIANCPAEQSCTISGEWTVDEPRSILLLLIALLIASWAGKRRNHRDRLVS